MRAFNRSKKSNCLALIDSIIIEVCDTLDPDLLSTFLAFVDGGSLAQAASIVGRSASAVTAQMQRLEDIVGEPLLAPAGRGRALTPGGRGPGRPCAADPRGAPRGLAQPQGRTRRRTVRLGTTQDFADAAAGTAAGLRRSHQPRRLDLRSAAPASWPRPSGRRDSTRHRHARGGRAGRNRRGPRADALARQQVRLVAENGELPLALLDPPCGFRSAAIAALDAAGRPYRIAATSASLSGLRAAVRAGIAVTVRTARWIEDGIGDVGRRHALPELGMAEFTVRCRADSGAAAKDLAALIADGLDAGRPPA